MQMSRNNSTTGVYKINLTENLRKEELDDTACAGKGNR